MADTSKLNKRAMSALHYSTDPSSGNFVTLPDGKRMRQDQSSNIQSTEEDKVLTHNTAIPTNVFVSTTQVDIRVTAVAQHVTGATLVLVVRNAGVGIITPSPAWLMVDHIEILQSNGTEEVQEILGEAAFFHSGMHLSPDQLEIDEADLNVNKNLAAPLPIGPGETREFRLRMIESIWNVCRFYQRGVSAEMVLRVFFRTNPVESFVGGAGAADLRCDSITLRFAHSKQNPRDTMALEQMHHVGPPVVYNFIETQRFTERKVVAAAQSTDFVLHGISGVVPYLYFGLFRTDSPNIATTGFNNRTPSPIQSFELVDSADANIQGGQGVTDSYNRFAQANHYSWAGKIFQYLAMYFVTFTEDPHGSFLSASNLGNMVFEDGREKLKITTPGVAATEVPDIWTVTLGSTTGLGTPTPTAGTFSIGYGGYRTVDLPFGSSDSVIDAAMLAAFNKSGLVFNISAGGSPMVNGATISVSEFSTYQCRRVPSDNGKGITVYSGMQDATSQIIASTALTTSGVIGLPGWVAGEYTLKVYAATFHTMTIDKGRIMAKKL